MSEDKQKYPDLLRKRLMILAQKNYTMMQGNSSVDTTCELSGFEQNRIRRQTGASRHKDHDARLLSESDGPATWAHRLIASALRWHERRVAIRMLEGLNDHYLMDVGIERADIPSFVAKGRKTGERQ